ncbi:MAG TPA: type II toxin-antitoxin system prevent-host-death family antitoxin [Solirubrobacteraceae bacterium]|nr:type II toxin-antitoxin system prevent-host-death family antitoxin [Solirubrobacteraceae bacterium]
MEMETVSVSVFKATCLAALERVRTTGRPLLVTKRGVPLAQVLPPPRPAPEDAGYGVMRGTAEEIGDIVGPLGDTVGPVGDTVGPVGAAAGN